MRHHLLLAAGLSAAGLGAGGIAPGALAAEAERAVVVTAVTRVSENAAGQPARDFCDGAVISPNGRYVAFHTGASNMVANDTNGVRDVFIRDLATGKMHRASVDATGGQTAGGIGIGSFDAFFTPDGNRLLFTSDATSLVPAGLPATRNIYAKNLRGGAVDLVSTTTSGAPANGDSSEPVVSGDGRILAFRSRATNLDRGTADDEADVFVKDLRRGRVGRASASATGAEPDSYSGYATQNAAIFSPDGRRILFGTLASNLVPGDRPIQDGGLADIFMRDLYSGALTRISTTGDGVPANGDSFNAVFSPDGEWVGFTSAASNLVDGDSNNRSDGFIKNLATGEIRRVTTTSAGAQLVSGGNFQAFSPDGSAVVIGAYDDGVVPGVTAGGRFNLYLKFLDTGAAHLISSNVAGEPGNDTSSDAVFSADGRRIVFVSKATNLVAGAQSRFPQVYVATIDWPAVDAGAAAEPAAAGLTPRR